METILLTSGFIEPALAAVKQHWHVIDIECQREALDALRTLPELPAAVCIGRTVDIGDDLDAWQMLKGVRGVAPGVPVLISTSETSPQVIVDLVKNGAFDYVLEPQDRSAADECARYAQELVFALNRAVEWRAVVRENQHLKEDLLRGEFPDFVVGRSRQMTAVMDLIRKVAPTTATVLVTGESGTGKELVARSIHSLSSHKQGPFVALNCGSFSENLIASELFGHEKGAFTGADQARRGLIREAEGGTLFLDEIATIPPSFQVMLLRVLEQRVARPVGGTGDYAVNCRFIAAANRDLEDMVRAGSFREDLFYRLNVFNVHVPPLRDRREDIPLLANVFVQDAAREYNRTVNGLTPGALALLESADWPGNVRQLRNAIDRAVIVCEGELVDSGDLDHRVRGLTGPGPQISPGSSYDQAMRSFEYNLVKAALQRAQGNRSEAARILQIKRGRLNYRLRQLDLA
jgi:DNA-binding NtrC family response regulator